MSYLDCVDIGLKVYLIVDDCTPALRTRLLKVPALYDFSEYFPGGVHPWTQ